jgi:uncharacterized protein (TIGR02246 family)
MKTQRALAAIVVVFVVGALAFARPAGQNQPAGGQTKAGARGQTALGSPADEAAVRALVEQYQRAFNAHDAATAAAVYTDDGVFVDVSGQAYEGRPAIEKEMAGGDPSRQPRLSLTVGAVRFIKPDVALMRGTSIVEGGDAPPGQGAGHWAVVCMKVGGQWKVVAAQAAANPPPMGRGQQPR